ncbi:hypothetical protein PFZ49_09200, partial [Microbacterium lacticum]|uniref:hypothetical protein n=1 Tax=Microbacterium lacticum TaxID=33885 RepID=UPI003A887EB8
RAITGAAAALADGSLVLTTGDDRVAQRAALPGGSARRPAPTAAVFPKIIVASASFCVAWRRPSTRSSLLLRLKVTVKRRVQTLDSANYDFRPPGLATFVGRRCKACLRQKDHQHPYVGRWFPEDPSQ